MMSCLRTDRRAAFCRFRSDSGAISQQQIEDWWFSKASPLSQLPAAHCRRLRTGPLEADVTNLLLSTGTNPALL